MNTPEAPSANTPEALYPNLAGTALDYSQDENWLVKQADGSADVDVFYLYPTAVDIACPSTIGEIDQFVRASAQVGYEKGASCFSGYANIFVPLYRQMSFQHAASLGEYSLFVKAVYETVVRTDIYAALDYFFAHFNGGKPYILAGISQGSYGLQIILSEYMRLHPERYSRMVACYAIGASFDSAYQQANPHVKMATGETDTGVVVAWNTEAPGGDKYNMLMRADAYCINPLNWKTDDTYASAAENKGTYLLDQHVMGPGLIDAQIDLDRHVLVTTTAAEHGYVVLPEELGAGDKSYHLNECDFFYGNLQDNGYKRVKAFLGR